MDEKSLLNYFANLNTLFHNVLNFHWNVTGGLFLTLHELYNKQYDSIFNRIDHLAEILKTNNIYPLTQLSDIENDATIKTLPSKDYTARETIEQEIKEFQLMLKLATNLGDQANKKGDLTLVDFFTDEANFFNKQLYFLRQFIK